MPSCAAHWIVTGGRMSCVVIPSRTGAPVSISKVCVDAAISMVIRGLRSSIAIEPWIQRRCAADVSARVAQHHLAGVPAADLRGHMFDQLCCRVCR